jgi:hypothetical protein
LGVANLVAASKQLDAMNLPKLVEDNIAFETTLRGLVERSNELDIEIPKLVSDNTKLVINLSDLVKRKDRLVASLPQLAVGQADGDRLVAATHKLITDLPKLVEDGNKLLVALPRLMRERERLIDALPRLVRERTKLTDALPKLVADTKVLNAELPKLVVGKDELVVALSRLVDGKNKLADDIPKLVNDKTDLNATISQLLDEKKKLDDMNFAKLIEDTTDKLDVVLPKLLSDTKKLDLTFPKLVAERQKLETTLPKLVRDKENLDAGLPKIMKDIETVRRDVQSTSADLDKIEGYVAKDMLNDLTTCRLIQGTIDSTATDLVNLQQKSTLNMKGLEDTKESMEKCYDEALVASRELFGEEGNNLVDGLKLQISTVEGSFDEFAKLRVDCIGLLQTCTQDKELGLDSLAEAKRQLNMLEASIEDTETKLETTKNVAVPECRQRLQELLDEMSASSVLDESTSALIVLQENVGTLDSDIIALGKELAGVSTEADGMLTTLTDLELQCTNMTKDVDAQDQLSIKRGLQYKADRNAHNTYIVELLDMGDKIRKKNERLQQTYDELLNMKNEKLKAISLKFKQSELEFDSKEYAKELKAKIDAQHAQYAQEIKARFHENLCADIKLEVE